VRVRTTINLAPQAAKEFVASMKELGISKDAFLERTLPHELNFLRALPKPTTEQRQALDLVDQVAGLIDPMARTAKLSITLGAPLLQRINKMCKEKRVRRDDFFGAYIGFLVNGDDEIGCPSPLSQVKQLLTEPRTHYYESQQAIEAIFSQSSNPYRRFMAPTGHELRGLLEQAADRITS